jgi:outer membrane protein assembly factor BamB
MAVRGSGALLAAALLGAAATPALGAPALAGAPGFVLVWSKALPDRGHPVGLSSPNVATLAGGPAVVVGDRAGRVYAFELATGKPVPGWPATTGGIPVDSTPSVAAVDPGSRDDTVFVGVGNASTPSEGGYEALRPNGTRRWYVAVRNPATDRAAGATSAVVASLAVGDLQGGTIDVVAPSLGQEEYALNAATGKTLPGFPWFTADSSFSTPALADLYGGGQLDIVEGGDQTAGLAYKVNYTQGGHLRVISPLGHAGTRSPTGGLRCESNLDQGVESSPAVGPFLGGGAVGIVVGTSHYWRGAAATDKVLAFTARCHLAWEAALDGATESSPALAHIAGSLAVLEGTDAGAGRGSVYALRGTTGRALWRSEVGEVIGGVVSADLGEGYQDVVVGTTEGAEVLDGRNGHLIATLARSLGLQNCPLITEDPNGTVGITLAGYNGHNEGEVEHFELPGSNGAEVEVPGAWPMFHHDPQLSGNAAAGYELVALPPR